MFNPTRDQSRHFLFETWRKHKSREVLTGQEAMALEHILRHTEYHAVLDDPARNLEREWRPEDGETNPFLHLVLHLTLSEQLSIDQPVGIRDRFNRLLHHLGNPHDAQHAMLECLAEMIWVSQRHGKAFDSVEYLDCMDRKAGKRA
jgi:Domain of unknown function (DUF1841)